MTWYKEEFPGVMAATGNVMKEMGITGEQRASGCFNVVSIYRYIPKYKVHDKYKYLIYS